MDYEQFKTKIYELTHIDLNYYKERQMKRRIDALMAKYKIYDYEKYVDCLKSDKNLFEEFIGYITINVSEFYRNPEQWEILTSEIIPYLMELKKGPLKVWSAACSTGDEPYSLAMVLSDFFPLDKIQIYATDIDKQVLEKARIGLYNKKSISGLPQKYVDKFLHPVGEKSFQICDEIKKCVKFENHDLLKDAYKKDFDLILCRNVVIYFTDEAKTEIYKKFNDSMNPGGVLFVGSTEQIINYRDLNYTSVKSFFYKKNM